MILKLIIYRYLILLVFRVLGRNILMTFKEDKFSKCI